MVKLHGIAIKSTTYVNTYQAERLAPNDVLDLELKYKNHPEVLAILNMAAHPYAAIEEAIEEHDEDSEDLEELDRMRGDVDDTLGIIDDSLILLAESLFEDSPPDHKEISQKIEDILILVRDLKDRAAAHPHAATEAK